MFLSNILPLDFLQNKNTTKKPKTFIPFPQAPSWSELSLLLSLFYSKKSYQFHLLCVSLTPSLWLLPWSRKVQQASGSTALPGLPPQSPLSADSHLQPSQNAKLRLLPASSFYLMIESKLFSKGCLLSSLYFLSCNPATSSYLGVPGHIVQFQASVSLHCYYLSGRPIPLLSL